MTSSRAVVVYATREGQARKVAQRVSLHLGALGMDATIHDAGQPWTQELGSFDLIVLGASMHAGGLEREFVRFVTQHQRELAAGRTAFFLVLLSAATKDPELRRQWLADARSKVESQLPIRFPDIEMIAGALMYSKYPLPLRWVMRRIARKAGEDTDTSRDYEYTDWAQVEAFARGLVSDDPAS